MEVLVESLSLGKRASIKKGYWFMKKPPEEGLFFVLEKERDNRLVTFLIPCVNNLKEEHYGYSFQYGKIEYRVHLNNTQKKTPGGDPFLNQLKEEKSELNDR